MAASCPHCSCTGIDGARAHRLLALLAIDDLDAAIEHGLLESTPCKQCSATCNAMLLAGRDACLTAQAARERHRARDARLRRRKAEREAARIPKVSPATPPALPTAAANVLARALAKARTPK